MNAAQLHLKPDTWMSIMPQRDLWHLVGKPVSIKVKVLHVQGDTVHYDLSPVGYPLVRGRLAVGILYWMTRRLYDASRPWCTEPIEVELSAEQLAFMTDYKES